MFCEKCGMKIDDDSVFCENCGAKQTYIESMRAQNITNNNEANVQKCSFPEPIVPVDAPAFGEEGVFERTVSIFDTQQKAPDIYTDNSIAEQQYAEPQYAEQQYAEQQYAEQQYAEQQYANNQYANNQYANNQYANYPANSDTQYPQEPVFPMTDSAAGEMYETEATEDVNPKDTKKKGKKVWVIILCIVLVLALIGGGVFAAFKFGLFGLGKSSTTKEDTSVSQQDKGTNEDKNSDSEKEDKPEEVPVEHDVITSIIDKYTSYTEVGVYVINSKTGYQGGYNYDKKLASSAMSQVVILDALSEYVSANKLDIDKEGWVFDYYLKYGKQTPDSKSDDGKSISLREYIEGVAIYGDNNKSNQLIDYMGSGNAKAGFKYINSFTGTDYPATETNRKIVLQDKDVDYSVAENSTSAKDIANIFRHLIKHSSFGDESYMKSIFKPIDGAGNNLGIMDFFDGEYAVSSANAVNGKATNDVAIISKGDTEVVVAILCVADENHQNTEGDLVRKNIQKDIIAHILETQFTD